MGERGQVLVMAVGVMALGLGAIMISVDAGWWLRDKRDAQNDADAIALAAVQELPDRLAAELAGEDWAVANGIDPSTELAMEPGDCPDGVIQGDFCFIDQNGDGDDDKVRAKVSRPSDSFIAEALGVTTPTLSPAAAAATLHGVASCVMPWGIIAENTDPGDFYGLDPTQLYVFQDSDANTPGNYGAISIYGNGADVYKEVIEGSDGCPGPKPNACSDQVVEEGGRLEDCPPKPGTLGRITSTSLDVRFADSAPYSVCHAESYTQATLLSGTPECSDRGVPLAIIDAFPQQGSGGEDINVYGIAIFYIAGWDGSPPWGDGGPDSGDPDSGFVWGYLLTDIPVSPAWDVRWSVSDNPFAPVAFFLVE